MTADRPTVDAVITAVRSVKSKYPGNMALVSYGDAVRITNAVLAAVDTKEAAAKALEEAADEWQRLQMDEGLRLLGWESPATTWLRARAAAVRQEGKS